MLGDAGKTWLEASDFFASEQQLFKCPGDIRAIGDLFGKRSWHGSEDSGLASHKTCLGLYMRRILRGHGW